MSWPAGAGLPQGTLLQEEGWSVLCCWPLAGCSCSPRMTSVETLVLPSERRFKPLAPPMLSTPAKAIADACPTRAWKILTTVTVPRSILRVTIHVPAWMANRPNHILKVTLFQR